MKYHKVVVVVVLLYVTNVNSKFGCQAGVEKVEKGHLIARFLDTSFQTSKPWIYIHTTKATMQHEGLLTDGITLHTKFIGNVDQNY